MRSLFIKIPEISLIEWQKRYDTKQSCAKTLIKMRWFANQTLLTRHMKVRWPGVPVMGFLTASSVRVLRLYSAL